MDWEERLKHHGVKGMKWGVRRNRNRPGGADGRPDKSDRYKRSQYKQDNKQLARDKKAGKITRKQAIQARADNRHRLDKDNNKAYNKAYNKAKSRGSSERNARIDAAWAMKMSNDMKATIATHAAIGSLAAASYLTTTSGGQSAIRKGKNVIRSATGNPLKYADASKMTNVVGMATKRLPGR